jgi:hypothetical protein
MGLLRRILSLAVLTLPLAAFPHLAHAGTTDLQFNFSGTCAPDDCVGYGTGTLTVENYTPGDELTSDNFVSFTYSSSVYDPGFTIPDTDSVYLGGSIGSTPGEYDVNIYDENNSLTFFSSGTDTDSPGSWCSGACSADYGSPHVWSLASASTATPEPTSLALLSTGLAALPYARRRLIRGRSA